VSSRRALLLLFALASSACARRRGESAAPNTFERQVSSPSQIAALSSAHAAFGLNGEIRFGGALGRSALYLKFPSEWRARGIPLKAFLTLAPREGSASNGGPVTLEAWRIAADWQPQALQRWSDKPILGPPYARARLDATPTQDLRLDITELVRFAAQNPERDFGIAVIASGSNGPGQSFSTGLAGGQAPRLELYLR
jgi:hypothetical protein